jgi:hypothetical protein
VLDGSGLASDFNRLGVPYSVARAYTFEPTPPSDNLNDIKQYATNVYGWLQRQRNIVQNPNVYWYINNEQDHSPRRLVMYRCLIDLAMRDPTARLGWYS